MFTVIKKFKRILNEEDKLRVAKLFVITLIGAFFEVIGVSLMVPTFGAIMNPNIIETNAKIKWVCEHLGIESYQSFVISCLIALIVIFIIKNLYLVFEYYEQANFIFRSRFDTQRKLFHAFLCKPYEYYLHSSSGEIIRIINSDVVEAYRLLMTLVAMVTESIVSVALVLTMCVIDTVMTLSLAALLLIIIVFIIKIIRPKLTEKGDEYRENYYIVYNWLLQAIYGIKEMKIARREDFFEDNFSAVGLKQIQSERANMVANMIPRLFIEIGCVCSTLAVIAIMIYNGKPVEELIPTLSAFAVAAVKLMPSAINIIRMSNAIAYQGPAIDNLLEHYENWRGEFNTVCTSKHSLTVKSSIQLRDITYKYPKSDSYVLKNANCEIPVGTSVGIIGASGAGKTTAVDVMLGLLAPESGEILVDGVDVRIDYADWLSHIGYIPQTLFMLNDTIATNVAFGFEPDEERIWYALREAQMEEFVKSLPDGINTYIGERGIRLSGGQRQRLGIARALYTNPDILVFDEATSSLDNKTESAIMEAINRLHGKKTIIIIAHRIQTIEKCDYVYKVENGKII